MKRKNFIYAIEMNGANLMAFILAIAVMLIIYGCGYNFLDIIQGNGLIMAPMIFFWFTLHEIIHGISYRISKGIESKDVVFGALLEKGILYCLCKKKISKRDIIRSLLAPLILIGVLTIVIGIIFNLKLLILLSCLNIIGACADILMTIFILRLPADTLYLEIDNGTKFVIISGEDISKRKSLGVKFEKQENDFSKIEPKDFKKIRISKLSWIVFIVLILLYLVNLFV